MEGQPVPSWQTGIYTRVCRSTAPSASADSQCPRVGTRDSDPCPVTGIRKALPRHLEEYYWKLLSVLQILLWGEIGLPFKLRTFSNVLAVGSVKKRCSFAVKLECGFLQMWWYFKMAPSKGVFSENIKIDLNSLCHEAETQSWYTFKMFPCITDAYVSQ